MRETIGIGTGVSAEDQIRNEEALSELRRRAGRRTEDRGVGADGQPLVKAADVGYRSQLSVNEEMRDLLQEIADSNKKMAEGKPEEKAAAAPRPGAGAGVPLNMRPPGGNGARQVP
jgi:hypothetical protein